MASNLTWVSAFSYELWEQGRASGSATGALDDRIGYRHGRQESLGVGGAWAGQDVIGAAMFDHASGPHHDDLLAFAGSPVLPAG